jgi:hypothetical protein
MNAINMLLPYHGVQAISKQKHIRMHSPICGRMNSLIEFILSSKMKHFILTFTCIWLTLCATKCLSQVQPRLPEGQQVPCFFIFGDSLVDNGNNNAILTLARANYRPYGIDFPQGPTGRFTNGRTYVDALGNI